MLYVIEINCIVGKNKTYVSKVKCIIFFCKIEIMGTLANILVVLFSISQLQFTHEYWVTFNYRNKMLKFALLLCGKKTNNFNLMFDQFQYRNENFYVYVLFQYRNETVICMCALFRYRNEILIWSRALFRYRNEILKWTCD
jgi:hypothetical protein